MANGKRGVMRFRHLFIGFWLLACGGALGRGTAGGESHFLRQCEDECGAGLECVSGVCTRGCLVGEDKCTDLAADAECTDASIEPGALAVCDVSCTSDAGCSSLGAGFECAGGFCRGPVLPGQVPTTGTGGDGGSGATAGAGTGAVSTGGQPPSGGFYDVPECSGSDPEGDLETPVGGTPCPDGMACVNDYDMSGPIPPGICVGEKLLGACAGEQACSEGFECTAVGHCFPKRANCLPPPNICEIAEGPPCSYGYAYAYFGGVDSSCPSAACVPVTRCGCASNADCPAGTVCDAQAGQCQQPLPWQPPNECALPFDAGPCDALFPVFAFIDGACREATYGGCEGNANRYQTIEQCMAVCEGSPIPNPCPADRVQRVTCIGCGPIGPCENFVTVCAEACESGEDCPDGYSCMDGACHIQNLCL